LFAVDVEGSFEVEAVASSALTVFGFDGGVVGGWQMGVSNGVVGGGVAGGNALSWTILFGGVGGTDFSVAPFFGWEVGSGACGEEGVYHGFGCGG
jgi:hypothetical protein